MSLFNYFNNFNFFHWRNPLCWNTTNWFMPSFRFVMPTVGFGIGFSSYYRKTPIFNMPKSTGCSQISNVDTFVSSNKHHGYAGNTKVTPYNDIIEKYAKQFNVDSAYVKAVIYNESRFNPKAKSPCGAMGLMQLMPSTARGLGVRDAWNPEENIKGGVKLLRQLLDRYNGNMQLATAAYNAGPGRVKDKIPNIKETQKYVPNVMASYRQYKA